MTVIVESRQLLSGVSLALEMGEIALIRGRSGAGKSTLLRAIAGQQDGHVTGSIIVDGAGPPQRSKIGWVPQDRSLWSHMSLLENVAFVGRTICRCSRREAHERALFLLKSLGLLEQARQFPNTLSGGQARRGALARTLMANPIVLLLDEVTSGLDLATKSLVLSIVVQAASAGSIIVVTSHEADDAVSLPRLHTYYLENGVLTEKSL